MYEEVMEAARSLCLSCKRIKLYDYISNDKYRLLNLGERLAAKLDDSPIPEQDCSGNRLIESSDAWKVLVEVGKKKGYDLEKIAEDLQSVYDTNVFKFKATGVYKFFIDVWETANVYFEQEVRGDVRLEFSLI